MKKFFGGAVALSMLMTSVTHAAGYGIVDLEKIVEQSAYIKQQNASMQQQIKPQTAKIESLTKELEALQQRAQQGANLSDAEKKTMTQQYQTKLQELNTLQQKVQGTVESSIQALNRTMDSRIKQAAEQLRKENSLDVVLNKNSALAYDPKYDLTDKMIQKVNAIK
ncbi:OmpH family outer membrane protein [Acinetobacter pragensis]|uniref:OmpH family outer membrane protein n=1 Tax=Acinetobacter pragensis TaxID=1806892 RepID=UPI003341E5E4